jgi:hypothetical protein
MNYTAYKGTNYEYKTTIPESRNYAGNIYELAEVFDNFEGVDGHKTALNFAQTLRGQGHLARVDAHSGFTAVYVL